MNIPCSSGSNAQATFPMFADHSLASAGLRLAARSALKCSLQHSNVACNIPNPQPLGRPLAPAATPANPHPAFRNPQ
jgi:hypothetical protein